ncbi:Tryptophan 2,3-dioxygenase apoenzyme [Micromonospora nigra]|uniref:Tryptophan 2,3-dioxygenase apoenzyme n=1 Tax=Micromonospora nigra TaxID=145857 RepID=A0A1C6RC39_9ACTN|nr:tryptophan 2,3-dioxygenase family protein [Micromonospora nigra]SCL14722.1 Tryptophan 2,3-dioxygenase apoenzyme [Micromonospora nigra]
MTTDQDHGVEPAVVGPHRPSGGDYGGFLHLDALLAATREVPDHPDGRFFVLVHQAFEIWFELIVHELVAARADLFAGAVPDALYRLRRVGGVDRLLVSQLDTLGTISPGGFVSLRPYLGSASGFQSVRFREIEYVSGLRGRGHAGITTAGGTDRARLDRRLREPSLADAFRHLLRRRGIADPVRLLRGGRPDSDVLEVAEALLDHDEAWAMWRMRHALAVERLIGHKAGTGGSSGVNHLRSRRDERFFPDLWELRTRL